MSCANGAGELMTKKLDIAAIASQARVPLDDPAVLAFAKLVAGECVRIVEEVMAEHDRASAGLSLVDASAPRARRRLRDAFGLDGDRTSAASDAWSEQVEILMLGLLDRPDP